MTTTNTTTPMFEHPLHTLLTDLGFAEGDACFDIIDNNDSNAHAQAAASCDMTFDVITEDNNGPYATLCAPTGFRLGVQLPDNPYPASQLETILYGLRALSSGTYDLDEATEEFTTGDDPQETRDTLSVTHMWAETQADRILNTGYALCDLMSLDPTSMPTEDFLPALWRYACNSEHTTILFTLLDEHLKATNHPFTRRPAEQ